MKNITVRHRKLGKHKAVGLAWGHLHGKKWVPSGKIEIDERQRGIDHLDSVVHELLHTANPSMDESEVCRQSDIFSAVLWKLGYRRIQI